MKRFVVNEIEDELASVERVLSNGGISSFHAISILQEVSVRGTLDKKLSDSIERVLSWSQMTQSPNSTAVTVAALGAVQALIDETRQLLPSKEARAGESFYNGLQRLVISLSAQLRQRRCHNELRQIHLFLDDISRRYDVSAGLDREVLSKVERFASTFQRLINPGPTRDAHLAAELAKALDNCRRCQSKEDWTFLLFGCSETVAKVLAAWQAHHLSPSQKVRLIVAEGRPKTQYGAHNVPSYLDAEAYCDMLTSCGVRPETLHVIPDACVATTMERGAKSSLPIVDAVLVGSNGIYFEPEIAVAHSAGHLMCAICAKHFNIPLIVLTSATKVIPTGQPGGEKLSRTAKWLTSDEELLERLAHAGARTDWNPREDRIPFALVHAIITDLGTVTKGSEEDAKVALLAQCRSVAELLNGSDLALAG